MRKELLLVIPILIVGLALTMGTLPSNVSDSTKPQGDIYVCVEKFSGTECHWIHNTITNTAKNQTRDIRMGNVFCANNTQPIGEGGYINCTWSSLIVSTDQGPVNATTGTCPNAYTSNGMASGNGTVTEITTSFGNYSTQYKFTATGTTSALYKLCLSNHTTSTSPLMASGFINNTISGYVLDANENITIYYYIAET